MLLNDLRNDIPKVRGNDRASERVSECPASLLAMLYSLSLVGYLNFPKRRRWLNISPPDMNSSTMYRLVLSWCGRNSVIDGEIVSEREIEMGMSNFDSARISQVYREHQGNEADWKAT